MNDEPNKYESQWHLDKKVPISLILAIFLQSAGFFWWGATLSERVNNIEDIVDDRANLTERITRQETLMGVVLESNRRIEDKLEKLIDEVKSVK